MLPCSRASAARQVPAHGWLVLTPKSCPGKGDKSTHWLEEGGSRHGFGAPVVRVSFYSPADLSGRLRLRLRYMVPLHV